MTAQGEFRHRPGSAPTWETARRAEELGEQRTQSAEEQGRRAMMLWKILKKRENQVSRKLYMPVHSSD